MARMIWDHDCERARTTWALPDAIGDLVMEVAVQMEERRASPRSAKRAATRDLRGRRFADVRVGGRGASGQQALEAQPKCIQIVDVFRIERPAAGPLVRGDDTRPSPSSVRSASRERDPAHVDSAGRGRPGPSVRPGRSRPLRIASRSRASAVPCLGLYTIRRPWPRAYSRPAHPSIRAKCIIGLPMRTCVRNASDSDTDALLRF